MDDNITDTTKDTNQEPKKDTTLDLTGLKHDDEETLMNEAIEKVNQVENLEQLEKIDKLTNQEVPKDEPKKETEKEAPIEKQAKSNVKEEKNEYDQKEESTEPIEKPKEPINEKPEPQKTEIKLEHNPKIEKNKNHPPKNEELKEEDIVLEMSGGIIEEKKKKIVPKIKIGVPKFDKSKKIIYVVVGGLITLTAITSIVIFIVLPKVKTYMDNKGVDEEITTTETKPTKPKTIREQIDKDRISNMLLESSASSILKDILLDTQKYPISDINKELEAVKDEQSTQEQPQ